jgi:hypothetical protein
LKTKTPTPGRGILWSCFNYIGFVGVLCHANLLAWRGDLRFWGLTGFDVGSFGWDKSTGNGWCVGLEGSNGMGEWNVSGSFTSFRMTKEQTTAKAMQPQIPPLRCGMTTKDMR